MRGDTERSTRNGVRIVRAAWAVTVAAGIGDLVVVASQVADDDFAYGRFVVDDQDSSFCHVE
ncbi:hypothetical protein K0U83_14495 [bacterium]|nr:hypothetical protein [bacterium]